ncbi:hypothetical protein H0I29_05675 [Polaribacter sp. R2A056_3_33]|uniref:hypothetical protein n=1 Tax=Polaribacter sp. R2A056_3_33 TaxID=2745563 RepID=UPI001C4EEFB3|nr:hypothetical protein [Polaribacter sp. R2A056_3_33]QXP71572.1 hypothetical protein H0I29_05675 [Polaribacter sp. R2A056_3_33]
MIKFIKKIIKACPYSIMGKKCIETLQGKKKDKKKNNTKIETLKKGIKTGRDIILIGIFCPLLWYSILSGASKDLIIINLMHSGVIVALGFVLIVINYLALFRYKNAS